MRLGTLFGAGSNGTGSSSIWGQCLAGVNGLSPTAKHKKHVDAESLIQSPLGKGTQLQASERP